MRVFLTNLGCKLNQAENERLARQLAAAGHQVAASLADADVHVVNTCTVTSAAARTSRKAARAAANAGGDEGARPRTVLTGCHATLSAAEAAALPGVDLVVPNAEKESLVDRLHAAFPDLLPTAATAATATAAANPATDVPCAPALAAAHTRALLKVEDGCDMRCSFCIIPTTRGAQRSRPLAEVVAEARALAAAGFREIVVTGVQISAYRRDGVRLAGLVGELLAALPADVRLRLTSIAPWDLDQELLDLWAESRLCRHLHLSLQSGATPTLRRMRRPYTAESYLRLVERVRAAIPGAAVTTDVIVGFPGETDDEFGASLAAVDQLAFAKVHVFPYSPRPGTAAASLPGAVPAGEQRRRMDSMLAVAARAELAFHQSHLGRRATVLWEHPRDGRGHGLTDNYIRVFAAAGIATTAATVGAWNTFTEVELAALTPGGMIGHAIRPAAAATT
jgi:threonylcarbamoyladenosine tRNA methylthiotransferase MtaB